MPMMAPSKSGSKRAMIEFQAVGKKYGLTVSVSKTKQLVTGREAKDSDRFPIPVCDGEIDVVEEFPYLGSILTDNGKMDADVERRLAQASREFGALRKAVFLDRNLRLQTKRKVYEACVLSVLLYGSECWVPLRRNMRRLNSFHHRKYPGHHQQAAMVTKDQDE